MTFVLPPVGSSIEKNRLDCKKTYADGPDRAFEMAKDVAAFANANGGAILVGSVEAGGVLKAHLGLDAATAGKIRRALEEAVRDLVRPAPVIDFPEPVPLEKGNVILVVEVQPFPGQAVGVRVGGTKDEHPWRFPVRVGTQTVWYSPEQLVLLMDVAHRRKAQMLFLAKGERCGLFGAHGFQHAVDVIDVNPMENSVSLKVGKTKEPIFIPLDVVRMVWRTQNQWCIRLHGQVIIRGAPRSGVPAVAVYVETEENVV